jgi:hypothetical protein
MYLSPTEVKLNSCGETDHIERKCGFGLWSKKLSTESKTNIKRPDATGKKVNATHPLQEVET